MWEQREHFLGPPESGPQNFDHMEFKGQEGGSWGGEKAGKEQLVAKSNQLILDLVGKGLGAGTSSANMFLPPRPLTRESREAQAISPVCVSVFCQQPPRN